MSLRNPVVALMTLVWAGQSQVFAASLPLELKWDELHDTIYGHAVELKLPGSITIKGDVAVVRADALVLNIQKTSNSKAFPKGNAVIPRSAVTLLKVETHRRSNWHTMGTVVGVLAGVVVGGYITGKTASDAGPGIAIFLGSASAIAIAGSMAGRATEKKTTMIRVVQ